MSTQMTAFSATNAKQLDQQTDRFTADHPDFVFNFGREGELGTWYAHGAYGAMLRTGMSFDDLVKYANEMAKLEIDAE